MDWFRAIICERQGTSRRFVAPAKPAATGISGDRCPSNLVSQVVAARSASIAFAKGCPHIFTWEDAETSMNHRKSNT